MSQMGWGDEKIEEEGPYLIDKTPLTGRCGQHQAGSLTSNNAYCCPVTEAGTSRIHVSTNPSPLRMGGLNSRPPARQISAVVITKSRLLFCRCPRLVYSTMNASPYVQYVYNREEDPLLTFFVSKLSHAR